MVLIDTHCHLNDEKFFDDLEETIGRAENVGVRQIINFGDTVESSSSVVKLAEKFSGLYAGVGVHPEEVKNFDKNSAEKILSLAKNPKVLRKKFSLSSSNLPVN